MKKRSRKPTALSLLLVLSLALPSSAGVCAEPSRSTLRSEQTLDNGRANAGLEEALTRGKSRIGMALVAAVLLGLGQPPATFYGFAQNKGAEKEKTESVQQRSDRVLKEFEAGLLLKRGMPQRSLRKIPSVFWTT